MIAQRWVAYKKTSMKVRLVEKTAGGIREVIQKAVNFIATVMDPVRLKLGFYLT